MVDFPNAKINIGLNIVEKRNDGFHNIETVMYPIDLCDTLEIVETSKSESSLEITGINIDGDVKDNLCFKALRLLRRNFSFPSVDMFLHKNIPLGAGLGGGSSNAVCVLKMVNKMFDLKIQQKKMIEYAAELGSDCAFFVENEPCFACGRGEILEKLSIDLSKFEIVLIKPPIAINTAWAYSKIIPQKTEKPLYETIKMPVEKWKYHIKNDFEKDIFSKYPEIAEIKNKFYDGGAVYASMSGSGSSVFGLFEKKTQTILTAQNYFVFCGKM